MGTAMLCYLKKPIRLATAEPFIRRREITHHGLSIWTRKRERLFGIIKVNL